ncbi:DinB family protein [Leptospira perdikensis]|uniref:DinB family protein n=1 Tax=Leptospira perdikensis TaxID=2484948 RepID=A0A4R9JIY4_9LEPT|nr:DinB family protein [Leptospira perdikensis]TGL40993.1 DinB family protein [Leptospira perdikensis]
MNPYSSENCQILEQGILLLESISNESYERKFEVMDASIGGHFRHILEHYDLFWEGLKTGHIDYDNRKRNPKLETDRLYAISSLLDCTSKFQKETFSSESVVISQNYNPWESVPMIPSSINRELKFLVSHTVHHYAIVSILVKLDGGTLPNGFGFSPATLFAKATTDLKI